MKKLKLEIVKNQTENKKVRNATKVKVNGTIMRSKLEGLTYIALTENKIKFEYEKNVFEIFPGFRFLGSKKTRITYTPDFVGSNFIIECKGPESAVFKMKWKMLMHHLLQMGQEHKYKLFIIHNEKELKAAVKAIKEL